MTVEAVFALNDSIEPKFFTVISSSFNKAECTLLAAYPDLKRADSVNSYRDEVKRRLWDLLRQARELSYAIQHDVFKFSGYLVVTNLITSDFAEGNEMNGFGLDKVSTEGRECLLNAGTGRD